MGKVSIDQTNEIFQRTTDDGRGEEDSIQLMRIMFMCEFESGRSGRSDLVSVLEMQKTRELFLELDRAGSESANRHSFTHTNLAFSHTPTSCSVSAGYVGSISLQDSRAVN